MSYIPYHISRWWVVKFWVANQISIIPHQMNKWTSFLPIWQCSPPYNSHTKETIFFQKGWNHPIFASKNHFQKFHEITIVRNVPPIHHALLQLDHLSLNPPKCHGPWLKILGPTGPPTRTFQFQPGIRFCQHAIVEKGKTKKPLGSLKCASLKPAMEGHQKKNVQ